MGAARVVRVLGLALSLTAGLACSAAVHRTRTVSALDAEYLSGRSSAGGANAAATRLYRQVLSRSLGSRCQMFPTDSQLFDRRARDCGAATAAILGIARLFLETEATPEVLPSLVAQGRLRWLDLPPAGSCGP